MHLLNFGENGELTITSFDDNATPCYAILSHTWGANEEEVTFADIVNGGGKNEPSYIKKLGYKKIRFCGQQARQDGLQYFWVDTCCIDKSDTAEFSHAIKSMPRWYQNATKGYVYLSDVSTKMKNADSISTEFTWEPAFRSSRWFSRGWMLQEYLMLSTAQFFSQEWEKLGDNVSLKPLIQKITGIPQEALDGALLSQFIAKKGSLWSEGRENKYEDDKAYSQQGNLNVDLVSMDGEGTNDGTFESYTATIRQKELDAQDQDNWNKNLNASDEDSDRASVISQTDSIWSVASLESTATGFSAASGYSPAQIETATKELLRIFLEHDNLASLYKIAMERAHIGPERLLRNVRRLLRAFARDLQADADSELEKLAARLVSFKSAYVARSVIEKYEVKSLRTFAANLQPLHVSQKDDESSDEEEEVEEEEGYTEDHVDEDLIEDLSAFRQFLAEGVAFAHFQRQLEAFVRPKPVEVKGGGGEKEHSSRMLLSKSQIALESLFIAAGFLEPPIDPGMVRIRWRCRCGESFFSDVKEYRADGVKEITEKMSRSTGAKVTVTSYGTTSTNQNWTFKTPVWARRIATVFSSAQAMTSNSTGCLPQHNVPNNGTPLTSLTPATNTAAPLKPTLHLLACMHRTQRRKCLLQDPIDLVSTDRALFCFMKRQLQRNRSRIRSTLAMRSVQGIFFVKFRLRIGNVVEVRDHNPCCISMNPNTCECIPPVPKVEPSPNAEYSCSPAGPLATWPPVLSQDLMHMLSSPQCINEQETWVCDQLPKRTVGELQARAGQLAEGWGIYYQEGMDFDMIIGVVFVVFILASLLFAILWTRLEMDIQGAFGVSSYMVTASGIFLAWMASRAKNFG